MDREVFQSPSQAAPELQSASEVVLQTMLYFILKDMYRPQGMVGHLVLECALSV